MNIKAAIKRLYGQPVFQLKIFFINIFSVTKYYGDINIYILYLPFLRILKSKNRYGINLLVLAWIFDFISGLNISKDNRATKFNFHSHALIECVKSPEFKGIKICGRNFYSITVKKPFNFPTAAFKG